MSGSKKNDKTIVIMGNGPSLADVDFNFLKNFNTFGLNMAYKMYSELDFYPRYFGSFDEYTNHVNKHEFQKLIDSKKIEKLFFVENHFHGDNFQHCNVVNKNNFIVNQISKTFTNFNYQGNSGVMACQASIIMGYTKIILVGVDQDYVEQVDGSVYDNNMLKIVKPLDKNPNYWFKNYHSVGEYYNKPNSNVYHTPAWNSLPKKLSNLGVEVVNCNPNSKLECFRKSELTIELGF